MMESANTSICCFTQLLGQDKAKMLLGRSLAAGRLAHAYLFKGPEGVGKTLFAHGLAAAVNCRTEGPARACGQCPSCRKFRSGNQPDFLVVGPDKGMIKIDQVRRLFGELSYPPYESAMRVVVLEEVQTMRREAANSLLKTLEEPPAGNLLILTAEPSQEILPTLISRCQVIPFFPLTEDQTVTVLGWKGIAPEEARVLARLAEGSPGRAMRLHKTAMLALWRRLTSFLTDREAGGELGVGELLRLAEEMADLKEDLGSLLALLRLWLRDLLVGEPPGAIGPGGWGDQVKSWNSHELFGKLMAIDRADRQLARNCNRNLVCEVLLFHLR